MGEIIKINFKGVIFNQILHLIINNTNYDNISIKLCLSIFNKTKKRLTED